MKYETTAHTTIVPITKNTQYILGWDLIDHIDEIMSERNLVYSSFLVLADKTTFSLYGKRLVTALKKIGVPVVISHIESGETNKSMKKIEKIITPYFRYGFNRKSCLITLGGGVVSDMGGFTASILLRGISCIHIPTTLLSMVDAALGGKTGVNFLTDEHVLYKNMIGSFYQPEAVISDVNLLSTLPSRELTSGLGEMMKYYIGWGTPSLTELIRIKEGSVDKHELAQIIQQCQKIKTDVVSADPFETTNERYALNLGHTIGHAIETAGKGAFSHGEAVSIGLVGTSLISVEKGLLEKAEYVRIVRSIKSLGLPVDAHGLDKTLVKKAIVMDKKSGTFVLIKKIGKLTVEPSVDVAIVEKALEVLL